MLFTLDKDFSDARRFAPGEGGLVFLRLRDTRQATINEALDVLHSDHDLEDFRGCLVVVRPPYVRIVRP